MNSDRRAKVAAAATVVGLAALGGAALGSNHGLSGPVASVGTTAGGRAPIVTSASGSTTAGTQTAVLGSTTEARHNPIVTRTSAAAGVAPTTDD